MKNKITQGGVGLQKNSDKELLAELFKEYRQMMFNVAMGILHNNSDAEDAVQNSFLWIINNLDKISQIPCHERGVYFALIVEHRSIDICRKRTGRQIEYIEEQYALCSNEYIAEKAISSVTVGEIKDALKELPDREYKMLYMYLFKEMSPKEISIAMGISEKNIRTYIQRARKKFMEILRKRGINYDV